MQRATAWTRSSRCGPVEIQEIVTSHTHLRPSVRSATMDTRLLHVSHLHDFLAACPKVSELTLFLYGPQTRNHPSATQFAREALNSPQISHISLLGPLVAINATLLMRPSKEYLAIGPHGLSQGFVQDPLGWMRNFPCQLAPNIKSLAFDLPFFPMGISWLSKSRITLILLITSVTSERRLSPPLSTCPLASLRICQIIPSRQHSSTCSN